MMMNCNQKQVTTKSVDIREITAKMQQQQQQQQTKNTHKKKSNNKNKLEPKFNISVEYHAAYIRHTNCTRNPILLGN